MSKRTVELELATPGLDARGQPVRVPLGVAAAPGASDVAPPEPDLSGEHMLINLGPQHPATHGVLRLVAELAGETGRASWREKAEISGVGVSLKNNKLQRRVPPRRIAGPCD